MLGIPYKSQTTAIIQSQLSGSTVTISARLQSQHGYNLSTVTISARLQSQHGYNLSTVTISARLQSQHGYNLSTVTISARLQSQHGYNLSTVTISARLQSQHGYNLSTPHPGKKVDPLPPPPPPLGKFGLSKTGSYSGLAWLPLLGVKLILLSKKYL